MDFLKYTNNLLYQCLITTLCWQMIFAPTTGYGQTSTASVGPDDFLREILRGDNFKRGTPEQRRAFAANSLASTFGLTGQLIEEYDTDTGEVLQTWPLDRVHFDLPDANFSNLGELQFTSSRDGSRLLINLPESTTQKTNHRISIDGFGRFTVPPEKVVQNPTMITFATVDGIYVLPLSPELREVLFRAPVPIYRISSIPDRIKDIKSLEWQQLTDARQAPLIEHLDPTDLIFDSDLIITATVEDESHREVHQNIILTNADLQLALLPHMLYQTTIMNLLVANGDAAPIRQVLDVSLEGMGDLLEVQQRLVDEAASASPEPGLLESAMIHLAHTGGGKFLKSLALGQHSGSPSLLRQRAAELRPSARVGHIRKIWANEKALLAEGLEGDLARQIKERTDLGHKLAQLYRSLHEKWQITMSENYLTMMAHKLKDFVTSKTFAAVMLGSAAYGTASLMDLDPGQLVGAMFSKAYLTMQDWPLLGGLAEGIGRIGSSFSSAAAAWSKLSLDDILARWLPAAVYMVSFIYVAFGIVSFFRPKDLQDPNISRLQVVYSLGMRLLAKLNCPVQAIFLERIFRQRMVYALHDQGVDPLEGDSQATGLSRFLPKGFHAPWASPEAIEAKRKNLEQSTELLRSQVPWAEFVTALLVTHYLQDKNGTVDPATVLNETIMLESLGAYQQGNFFKRAQMTLEHLDSPEARRLWAMTAPQLVMILTQYIKHFDPKNGFDMDAYGAIFEQMQAALAHIKAADQPTIVDRIKSRWTNFETMVKKGIVPYVLLGTVWRQFSLDYRHAVASQPVARTSAKSGLPDNGFSMLLGALLKPDAHSYLTSLALDPATARNGVSLDILAETGVVAAMPPEQALFAGTLVPVGVQAAAETFQLLGRANHPIKALWEDPPVWAMFSSKARESYEERIRQALINLPEVFFQDGFVPLPMHRQQTLAEAFQLIREKSEISQYSRAHAAYIEKLTSQSIQGYLVLGSFAVALGFSLTSYVQGLGLSPDQLADPNFGNAFWFAQSFIVGTMANLAIIAAKYTFAGYAWVWPYSHVAHGIVDHQISDVNLGTIQGLVIAFAEGLIRNDKKILDRAIEGSKILYTELNETLPDELSQITTDSPPQEIARLALHLMAHPPAPTKESQVFAIGINSFLLLAVGTTLLYFILYSGVFASASDVFIREGTTAASLFMLGTSAEYATIALLTYLAGKHWIPAIFEKNSQLRVGVSEWRSRTALQTKRVKDRLTQGKEKAAHAWKECQDRLLGRFRNNQD